MNKPDHDPLQHAHNHELEMSVLAVLLDGRHVEAYSTLAECCPDIDAFYGRNNKVLALAIHEVAATGERPSAQLVAAHLACMPFDEMVYKITPPERRRSVYQTRARLAQGEYEKSALYAIGGFNAVSDAATVFSPAAGMRRNCLKLAAYLRQRRALLALGDAQRRLLSSDGSNQVDAIAADTLNALSIVQGKGNQTGGVALGAQEALERHDRAAERATAGQAALLASWGVPALDEACPLAPARFVVLAAKPGGGKTSLGLQVAQATRRIHGGQAVRMVSWEIPRADLAGILLAREVGCPKKTIDRGWMDPGQRDDYLKAKADWERDDIGAIFSGPDTRLGDIVAWIRLQHRLAGGRLMAVIVDYVQKLPGSKSGMREYDRVSEISAALTDLKNQLGICILGLAQYSRDDKATKIKPVAPRASDLRGSGQLEQDADAIVHLYPRDKGGDVVAIDAIIDKNRGFPIYVDENAVRLEFHKADGQIFKPPLPQGDPGEHSSGQTRWERSQDTNQKDPF